MHGSLFVKHSLREKMKVNICIAAYIFAASKWVSRWVCHHGFPFWHFRAVRRAVCNRWVYCNLFHFFFSIVDVWLGCKLLNEVQCIFQCHDMLEMLWHCCKMRLNMKQLFIVASEPIGITKNCLNDRRSHVSRLRWKRQTKKTVKKAGGTWQCKGKGRKINMVSA